MSGSNASSLLVQVAAANREVEATNAKRAEESERSLQALRQKAADAYSKQVSAHLHILAASCSDEQLHRQTWSKSVSKLSLQALAYYVANTTTVILHCTTAACFAHCCQQQPLSSTVMTSMSPYHGILAVTWVFVTAQHQTSPLMKNGPDP